MLRSKKSDTYLMKNFKNIEMMTCWTIYFFKKNIETGPIGLTRTNHD